MNCHRFIEILDEHLAGTLGPEARRHADDHLRECAQCRELARVSADLAACEFDVPADFAGSVLERTSGSPCGSARGRLCDFVDSELESVDEGLVRMHLQTCEACSGISSALSRLSADLPSLAELRPDAAFVDDVLARTIPPSWVERWTETWQRLIQRPRFALEGAYVGTFMLLMLFGVAGSPLKALPRNAVDLLKVNPVAEAREPLAKIEQQISERVGSFWKSTMIEATEVSTRVTTHVKSDLGTLLDRPASRQETDNDNRTDGDTP